jgi:cellulose synthase (UDP-forming)
MSSRLAPSPYLPPQGARRERAVFGGWFAEHETLLRLLAGCALLQGGVFLVWRFGWSWHGANAVLFVLLLVTEVFGFLSLAMQTWMSWRTPPALELRPRPEGLTVDVYVCTYDEPLDVLRATLLGCRALRGQHTTYVLDDGRRPEVAELARSCAAEYLTRADNTHAKAGNINAALTRTDGDLVFSLDADHVPLPDALDELGGYFDDPLLALVQSPHDFYNHDSVQHYGVGRHEQSVFFRVVCPGKDRHGAAFWCGSAALIRREALLEIGGVATETIAEDFHTTIRLHRNGWRSRYHNRLLVQGVAPHDLDSYLLQRDRWSRGNLGVLTTAENPLTARGLTPTQRLNHFGTLAAYLAGPVRLLTVAVLALVLWTGLLPMTADTTALLGLWLPWLALSMAAGSALSRGYMRIGEAVHFEQLTGWIYTRALRCAVVRGRTAFRVTPKEGFDAGGWSAVRQLKVLLALGTAVALGTVARIADAAHPGLLPALPGFAWALLPVLGVMESRRVGRTVLAVARHRQRRVEARFPAELPVSVLTLGEPVQGRSLDLNSRGIRLLLEQPLETGAAHHLVVSMPAGTTSAGDVALDVRILGSRPVDAGFEVRAAIDEVTSAGGVHDLVSWCYVWSTYAALREQRLVFEPAEADRTRATQAGASAAV